MTNTDDRSGAAAAASSSTPPTGEAGDTASVIARDAGDGSPVSNRAAPVRLLAWGALVLVLAGGFQPFYVRLLIKGTESIERSLTELPYRRAPGLRELLLRARALTTAGERIIVVGPSLEWGGAGGGYRYLYARSSYVLAGRTVLPLIDDRARPMFSPHEAEFAVVWRAPIPAGFQPLFANQNGVVARRVR